MSRPDSPQYPGPPGGVDPWQGSPTPDNSPVGSDAPALGDSGGASAGGYGTADGYGATPSGGYGQPTGHPTPAGGDASPYANVAGGYGTVPPPPPTQRRTNGLAIAAFVCGILPCTGLFSLVFGVIALVQVRDGRQKGKGLAIGGLALTVTWFVAGLVLIIVAVATSGADRDQSGQITSGGSIPVTSLRAGDCVNGLTEDTLTFSIPAVPCAEPHEGQVYSVFDVSMDGAWPGENAVSGEAQDRCLRALEEEFPGTYDDPAVELFYFHPSEKTWRTGDREIVCLTYYLDGRRSGSIFD